MGAKSSFIGVMLFLSPFAVGLSANDNDGQKSQTTATVGQKIDHYGEYICMEAVWPLYKIHCSPEESTVCYTYTEDVGEVAIYHMDGFIEVLTCVRLYKEPAPRPDGGTATVFIKYVP